MNETGRIPSDPDIEVLGFIRLAQKKGAGTINVDRRVFRKMCDWAGQYPGFNIPADASSAVICGTEFRCAQS